jgi:hypothetical protein
MERLGVESWWAGQHAVQPAPVRDIRFKRGRNVSMCIGGIQFRRIDAEPFHPRVEIVDTK